MENKSIEQIDADYGYPTEFRRQHGLPSGCELVTVTRTHYDSLIETANQYNAAAQESRYIGEWINNTFPVVRIAGIKEAYREAWAVLRNRQDSDLGNLPCAIADTYLRAGLFELIFLWLNTRNLRKRLRST